MQYDFNKAVSLYTSTVLNEYWNPDGRVHRSNFWHMISIAIAISVVASIVSSILGAIPLIGWLFSLAITIVVLALVPPALGYGIRRVHDLGMPWFFAIIPLYNIWLFAQPGETGQNAYGPDPLGPLAKAGFE